MYLLAVFYATRTGTVFSIFFIGKCKMKKATIVWMMLVYLLAVLYGTRTGSVFSIFFITICRMQKGYNCLDNISVPFGCALWNQNRLSVFNFFHNYL